MKDNIITLRTAVIKLSVLALLVFAGVARADDGGNSASASQGNGNSKAEMAHLKKHKDDSCWMKSDGCLVLNLHGVSGSTYTIQASTDMKNWTNIGTVTADKKGICSFTDASAAGLPQRFYRMTN